MAFVKLFPLDGHRWLAIHEILDRLRAEFRLIDADPGEGRDQVAAMIAATLRFSDAVPHKQAQLADLQSVQEWAVYITFGDWDAVVASCCLMPERALFFGSPDEVDGPARSLVERCAGTLNYELFEG